MKTALLFAGQATQYAGMGRHLYADFPEARAVFDAANSALGEPLTDLIFRGPGEVLDQTVNTQPAVLTVACAAWAILEARGFEPDVVAGHSLGEFGALVVAGALDFADAVRLCRRRGEYMQSAVPLGRGAMAAVIGAASARVDEVCRSVEGICDIAVDNAPGLVVISGEAESVRAAIEHLEYDARAVQWLPVSAPFHSSLLAPAAEQLLDDLSAVHISPIDRPYVANYDAEWIEPETADGAPEAIRNRLYRQVVGKVRWRESLATMLDHGIERFWHVGPGRTNLTHVKRQARRAPVATTDEPVSLAKILSEITP